ncbi:C-X-C chemokine receptor type 5 isoform X2 [Colossoma macropomum]|uniref:C-X-C chemokine receptor type 5 isoform X2 n=1 Tax=Colossoma macropomum TaxID=42526 RepID=UPI0018647F76|nr:C-X-C chemokine receptor type 5 isoform X2 [Colossoma macropomum]
MEFSEEDYIPENVSVSALPQGQFTCNDKEEPLSLFHTVFQPLVYSMVFLLGLTGNGLLLTILLQHRTHLRITEIYLLHLALADLLLLLTFPFAVAQVLTGWLFGDFLCKLLGLLNRMNMLCGSLLLACIGFDRYLAIVHAVSSLHSRRPWIVHLTCAILWLFCLTVTMPNMVFLSVVQNNESARLVCYFNNHGIHAYNWIIASRFLTHLLCFVLPLVVMGYCYAAVVLTLYQSQQSLEKQGAIRLAMVITLVFCLCWLPYNITLFVDTLVRLGIVTHKSCQASYALEQGLMVTESIGFTHCCLNPILYAFIGVRFRKDLLRLLAKWGCGTFCAPVLRAGGLNRVYVSEAATTTTSSQYI